MKRIKIIKDAMNEALRDWVTNVKDTFYIIGTAAGHIHIQNGKRFSICNWKGGSRTT